MAADKRKLSEFLAEVSEWRWDDFVRAELDDKYTTTQSIVFALIRACAMESLPAIKTALGRMDGRLVTPVRVVMPKVYFLYPNAVEQKKTTVIEDSGQPSEALALEVRKEPDLSPTRGFRETMDRMAEAPRSLPKDLIDAQNQIEKYIRKEGRPPDTVPRVKSVIAAHALMMAQNRDMEAISEVFDQLDGKLVETIRVVGEDMHIMKFDSVAPAHAVRNEEGVLMVEAPRVQEMWRARLDGSNTAITMGDE